MIKKHVFDNFDVLIRDFKQKINNEMGYKESSYDTFRNNLLRLEQKLYRLDVRNNSKKDNHTDINIELSKISEEVDSVVREKSMLERKLKRIDAFKVNLYCNHNDLLGSLKLYDASLDTSRFKNEPNLLFETLSESPLIDINNVDKSLAAIFKHRTPLQKSLDKSETVEMSPVRLKNSSSFLKMNSAHNLKMRFDSGYVLTSPKNTADINEYLKQDKAKNFASIDTRYKKPVLRVQKPTKLGYASSNRASVMTASKNRPLFLSNNELNTTIIYGGGVGNSSHRKTHGEPRIKFKERSLSNTKVPSASIASETIEVKDLTILMQSLTSLHGNANSIVFRNCEFKCEPLQVLLEFFEERRQSMFYIDLKGNGLDANDKNFRLAAQKLYSKNVKIMV